MTKPFILPIFSMLVLFHVCFVFLLSTEWAVHTVWFTNIVSATLFLPLLLFKAIGLPVFGQGEGFGWAPFTIFGWVLLCLFWATVYWGVATWANWILLKIRTNHPSSDMN